MRTPTVVGQAHVDAFWIEKQCHALQMVRQDQHVRLFRLRKKRFTTLFEMFYFKASIRKPWKRTLVDFCLTDLPAKVLACFLSSVHKEISDYLEITQKTAFVSASFSVHHTWMQHSDRVELLSKPSSMICKLSSSSWSSVDRRESVGSCVHARQGVINGESLGLYRILG